MKNLSLLFLLTLLPFFCNAVHLVGGEFELVHLRDFKYGLRLITYFDRAQVTNPGPDSNVTVQVFANEDHEEVSSFTLPLVSSSVPLQWTDPDCSVDDLIISVETYYTEIELDPAIYNSSAGYYIVWERCCRSSALVNIRNPTAAGTTLVMDFPAVTMNGRRFINSSPIIRAPLTDYACVGQLIEFDFSGDDADGDSLAYQIMIPLNSSSSTPLPEPSPKPLHMPVELADGIDEDNLIPGNPSLAINNKGILTVNPSQPGLFVYAVQVTEYRDGLPIGSLIREFQLLALDDCVPVVPPEVFVGLDGENLIADEKVVVDFNTLTENCLTWSFNHAVTGDHKSELIPVNFSEEEAEQIAITRIFESADSSVFEICLPECSFRGGEPLIFDLVASEPVCPRPAQTTIRVEATLPDIENNRPVFSTADATLDVVVGEFLSLEILATDQDLDQLELLLINPNNVSTADLGVSLLEQANASGEYLSQLLWEPDCDLLDIAGERAFNIQIVVQDIKECSVLSDTLNVALNLQLEEAPQLTEFADSDTLSITVPVEESLSLVLNGVEPKGTSVSVELSNTRNNGPDLSDLGLTFEVDQMEGEEAFTISLDWTPACSVFSFSGEDTQSPRAVTFILALTVNDENLCGVDRNRRFLALTVEGECSVTNVPDTYFHTSEILKVDESGVSVRNLPADRKVSIFDLSGREYEVRRNSGVGDVTKIDATLTRNRIYLMKIGSNTMKLHFR